MSSRIQNLLLLLLCFPFLVNAESGREVVTTRAELDMHLAGLGRNGSPLSHLSEPGRRQFIENLRFTTDHGIIPTNLAALYLELTPPRIRDILVLFGREDMAPHAPYAEKPTVTGHGSRHLETYYRYLEELQKINGPTVNTRQPDIQKEMREALEMAFGRHMSPTGLAEQTISDLRVLHEANAQVLFHTREPDLLARSLDIADRLAERATKRNLDPQPLLKKTHEQLLAASAFDQADAFAERHDLSVDKLSVELPPDSSGPAVLVPEQRSRDVVLRGRSVNLDDGVHVVATVSPACSFSLAATRYINSNEELRALLAGRTTWVVDSSWAVHLDKVLEWNREAGNIRMEVAYSDRKWPHEIELGKTPVFYIFSDGKLKDTVAGWLDDAQGAYLRVVLERLLAEESSDDAFQ